MPDNPLSLTEIDDRIRIINDNLRELVEEAAAYSGNADDDLTSERIAEQQAELDRLTKLREKLSPPGG